MDNELQKQIADVLQKALAAAQKGGEWIAGQVPDVLQQLLLWTIAQGVLALLAIIAIAIAWRMFLPRWWAWCKDGEKYEDRHMTVILVIFTALPCAALVSWLISLVVDGFKAAIAPKLFLLEYVAHLLK